MNWKKNFISAIQNYDVNADFILFVSVLWLFMMMFILMHDDNIIIIQKYFLSTLRASEFKNLGNETKSNHFG